MTKILLNSSGFVAEVTFFRIIVLPKSVMMLSKITSVINFIAKALKHFSEKYFCGYRGFDFDDD